MPANISADPPLEIAPLHPKGPVRVGHWDIIVRVTHWGTVLAIVANALVTGEGSSSHIWVGYGLCALLVLRLLWGLVGTRRARFSAFPPSPMRAIRHLRDIAAGRVVRHASHNPLGALMAYAVWLCLAVVIGTGIAMAGPPAFDMVPAARSGTAYPALEVRGFAGEDGEEEERGEGGEGSGGEEGNELFEEAHEIAVNLLYVLIALHLCGVIFETRRSGSYVVRGMLPGRSR